MARVLRILQGFLAGHRFAVFVLALVLFFKIFLLSVLFIPASQSPLGAFASDFRVWCFHYDPNTGQLDWAYVATHFGELLIFATAILAFWQKPLRHAVRHARATMVAPVAVALVIVAAGGFAFAGLQREARGTPVFPAASLRTHIPSPRFTLENQQGKKVSLEALRGRVVLLTGVYASCGLACPMILAQARHAVASLSEAERAHLTVIGVTLDPEHDTPEVLAEMAKLQKVAAPLFNLVTGDPAQVNDVLDKLGVERHKNAKTGVIDHTNVFALVDTNGKIAYRFGLGELQEQWLSEALHLLIREVAGES